MSAKSTTKTIHLIANSKSGRGKGVDLPSMAQRVCEKHGAKFHHYEVNDPEELEVRAREAVENSVDQDDVIVAAGGDGTLRTVAEILRGSGISYGVIPSGTFNYFARSHEIPADPTAALELILTGEPKDIRLGDINGRTFVINASLGLYAKSIEEREARRQVFGRFKLVSILSTFKTLLSPHRNLHVTLKDERGVRHFKTPMIFIGNNSLQLRNLSLSVAEGFKDDKLAVVSLKPIKGFEMLRVITRGILKTLEKEERLEQFSTDELEITTHHRHQRVALDGEMFDMSSPFHIRSVVGELKMIKP